MFALQLLRDFQLLYPASVNRLYECWDLFYKVTLNLAKNDVKDLAGKVFLKLADQKNLNQSKSLKLYIV